MRDLIQFESTPDSRVSNIVVTTTLDMNVQLELVALELGLESVEYEPEQFRALIYRDSESNAVFSLFSTRKLLCTGLSDLEAIAERVDAFHDKITLDG